MKTKLGWVGVVAAILMTAEAGAAGKAHSCCPAPAPAAVAPLSDRSVYQLEASWTNDAGEAMTLATLRGRPVVLAMFFANCTYACPILVNDMKRIRAELPAGVREKAELVLVTFDSDRDTPAALAAYRARVELDAKWTLVHGDPAAVQELAMVLGVKYQRDARGEFAHSNVITVLNPEGEIVHRLEGLNQDVASTARAVTLAAP